MKFKAMDKFRVPAFFIGIMVAASICLHAQVTGNPPQTSLPTSADGGNLGSGKLNFQPDLFTGRFTYSVPFAVPPGRQNSQPKLALNYNSSVGNGWCGVGWKLELGKIERETRYGVPVLGTTNGAYQYDDNKSFTVDFGGVEGHLVKVSPNGVSPVQYHLSVDKSYLIFNYYNNISNAYWNVVDKSGVQYFFGESISNRVDNPAFTGGYGTNTFRWQLDRVLDPNGNETFITYTNYNFTNQVGTNLYFFGSHLYPLQISYNANINSPAVAPLDSVTFVLTNRTDQPMSAISGIEIPEWKLLSQIVIQANGHKVNRYVLNYTNSPSTLRSLLTSVTEYGSDDTSSLPPVTFSYQNEQFGFGQLQSWGINSQGQTNAGWNSLTAATNGNSYVAFIDIDGDGLPDRVMRTTNAPFSAFVVQRNTGSNFVGNYSWGGLKTNYNAYLNIFSNNAITTQDFLDINGDGKPDLVTKNTATNWTVQINNGSPGINSFSAAANWFTLATNYPYIHSETNVGDLTWANEEMIDLNGDGILDRFISGGVQLNTGNGFSGLVGFPNLLSTYYNTFNTANNSTPKYLPQYSSGSSAYISLTDINGDGLPDLTTGSLYPNGSTNGKLVFLIEYNVGSGLNASWAPFGPILSEGFTNTGNGGYGFNATEYTVDESSSGTGNLVQMAKLIDINGDGMPDRVLTKAYPPYDRFKVQLNTGTCFGPLIDWTNVQSEFGAATNGQPWDSVNYITNNETAVSLVDINGDGLPDRVMRKLKAPYTNFWVQLNLGPFPDLLCNVSNGIGGSVQVSYVPSSKYDNTDRNWTSDPWAEGAKSLLPFPVYTVSSIIVNDGLGNTATNTYVYKHGMFDTVSREFRGFNSVAVADPYGAKTVTYFHQSGGFNDATNGEFLDPGTFSKKGMPYRVETWGTNGLLYQVVLNKVVETVLNTNGWYFPYTVQTIVMNYEGLNTYRATAAQFSYDTNTENLIAEADFGEVGGVVLNGQTFTDIGSDSIYKWMAYTNIGNIVNRPSDNKITADSGGTIRLQENLNSYDGSGNLKISQSWLDTVGAYVTTVSNNFDQYGNVHQTTDAAGVTTTITYDPTLQQFPISEVTGTFTSSAIYDSRAGVVLSGTDAKGLVSSNIYDVFFRPTTNLISTTPYGQPTLWQTKTAYSLGGINNGSSLNFLYQQVNDDVDPASGYQTYAYSDGLGRSIESRSESETNGVFRVANSIYDLRGNPYFQTLSYFSSGMSFTSLNGSYLGALTGYDPIGRASQSTPSVNGSFISGLLTGATATGGDPGSPVGPATTAFVDGSNPWATVVTDANSKVKKSYRDAYGRTIQVTDVTSAGNFNTTYIYDLVGNLTNVTDNALNPIGLAYDSLGRKKSMVDPDMGTWTYFYDNAGRLTQQIDSRANAIKFYYADQLGRLTSKQIYNSANALVGTVTYAYDSSGGDSSYTVYPGQLYKVTDLQGYQRSSYDVRGRVLKSGRFLSINAMEYVTRATYDDADRVQTLTYPGNAAIIQYTYDIGGNLSQVASTAGTGANEIFYTPQSFNALGQLNGYTNGNGVVTAYAYYTNSKRLLNLTTSIHGTNYQNLGYTYDNVSDVSSISDGVYSGSASAAISSIAYDDFYRVTSINSAARGIKTYGYNSIGNLLTNNDAGPGLYQYGAKPHAVTSANGVAYNYDACGNMTNRGSQTLVYDAQNQLIQVASANDSVVFGYDDSGERLWRAGTNGYTIWIGGIYEINNGKVLCHVSAGGQLIATFEPQCTAGLAKIVGEQRWYAASTAMDSVLTWPFRNGRGFWTMFCAAWAGILGICMAAGRRIPLRKYEIRRSLRPVSLWRQAVTLVLVSAFLAGSIGNVDAATYAPVFYYYHTDHLGSSNVLTDRSGNLVQHYEYSTFGQTSYQNNTSAFPISNRYTSQTADDETGLYYYGGRYYDPQLGRFIQPDPTVPDATDSQSFNRYSYCRNNPLNETDPSGFDDGGFGDGSDSSGGFDGFGDGNVWGGDWGNTDTSFSSFWSTASGNPATGSWSSSWSLMYGGVNFSGASGGMGGSSYSENTIAWGGGTSMEGTLNQYVPGSTYDGMQMSGYTLSTSFAFANSIQSTGASTPQAPAAVQSGGGWLSGITNAAGLLSMVPVIGDAAGLVNAAGEALQGHWGAAAWGVGGAALATFGLGFIARIGKAATESNKVAKAAKEGIIYLRTDATGGEYVGQAKNAARYAARQTEHQAANPTARFTFQELERVPGSSGRSLDVAEEDWIRAGGGPQSTGGRLQNARHQMNDVNYRKAGGTIPYP